MTRVIPVDQAVWEIPAQKVELGIVASRDLPGSQGREAQQVLRASLDPVERRGCKDSLAARVCSHLLLSWSSPVFLL